MTLTLTPTLASILNPNQGRGVLLPALARDAGLRVRTTSHVRGALPLALSLTLTLTLTLTLSPSLSPSLTLTLTLT